MYLNCTLASGFVKVGIRNSLPVRGITFILGNDLTRGKVMPVPEVTDIPSTCLISDDVAYLYPEVFSVTHAQSAKSKKQVDLANSLVGHTLKNDGTILETKVNRVSAQDPNLKTSESLLGNFITCSQITSTQKNDSSLRKCSSAVLSPEIAKKLSTTYLMIY